MDIWADRLHLIFAKTGGCCYHCGKKLSFNAYGTTGRRGSWEIDHSNPKARGGTGLLRNLVPSCVGCNRSKGALTSAEFRSGQYLRDAAPKPLIHPRKKLKNVRLEDAEKLSPEEQARYWREFRQRWPGTWRALKRVLGRYS
jgi:5-methylcytosine-specific restriction endonuclease McrA